MENKRAILAVVLSLAVLIGWTHFTEYMGWAPPRNALAPVVAEQPAESMSGQTIRPVPQAPVQALTPGVTVFVPTAGREVKVDTPLYTAIFHSGGGVLKSFELKHYREGIKPGSPLKRLVDEYSSPLAPMGLTLNSLPSWSAGEWAFEGADLKLGADESASLTFTGLVDGIRITRELTFSASTFLIAEKVRLGGVDAVRSVRLGFKTGSASLGGASNYDLPRVAWDENNSIKEESDSKKLLSEGVQAQGAFNWGGVMNNYFMTVVAPVDNQAITLKARIQDTFWGAIVEQGDIMVPAGGEATVDAFWWYGAKERDLLTNAPSNLHAAVYLGMFSVIARPLLNLLVFFHSYVGNWGVAIILLTCLVRIAFFPLSQKSYKSMEKMKTLQPMITKLREKYGDDKDKLNREVVQLYKTYGANPASGCLPILVQLPVFFGLYQALLNSLELRHAVFIPYVPFTDIPWLADLSAADPIYVSPLLMGGTMFLQQKMSPPAGEPLQQKIMLALPIVFTVMFLNFPSGLVVYWFFNNLLSIAQQWLIMRKRPA
ncbi:MAG: membrane protein insertase YidC [Deltaproteobacteria bacterium]|jgi:YidC/Oxa1 family membrane protein insertase|nr:membrane protein insertase YidC [Deltaproteobacteria bacterium]